MEKYPYSYKMGSAPPAGKANLNPPPNQLQLVGKSYPNNSVEESKQEMPKQPQMESNYPQNAQFSCTIQELLEVKLKPFELELKHIAFKDFKKALTPQDLTSRMQYVRCDWPIQFPLYLDQSATLLEQLKSQVSFKEDTYQYEKSDEWYVNFADFNLFGFYFSTLYAQDELQVVEHPLLAHVLEKAIILSKKEQRLVPHVYEISSKQQNQNPKNQVSTINNPTPILITNAFRLGHIDISSKNNPYGYYGNYFEHIPKREFTQRLNVFNDARKVSTNIIAMAAMGHQKGQYKPEQVVFTLMTAYKSFLNAKLIHQTNQIDKQQNQQDQHSQQPSSGYKPFVVHTGNWGTGAFGNNVVIIAVIQILAALMANVDQLVYHTFDKTGSNGFKEGWKFVGELLQSQAQWKVDDIVKKIVDKGFKWGISNGT